MPLTDLGSGVYQGSAGGLYPGGSNVRPAGHASAGLAIAHGIVPLDAAGAPDPVNGKIVLASLGMSNTTQETQQFLPLAAADASLNPRRVLVDGAQGGKSADQWADPANSAWTVFASRLAGAGATGAQLQVVWVKLAVPSGLMTGSFPASAQQVQGLIRQSILNLKSKYPGVRIVYLSSRIYAGYATTALNPEPIAYENGFSVKWLVEQQIGGDPALAFTGPAPPAPWLSWGPYLWADGLGSDNVPGGVPGRSDGLEWFCPGDYQADGTHPSAPGAQKVAQRLLQWLKTDETSVPWFLASPPALDTDGDGMTDAFEVAHGFDPAVSDQDADAIPDGLNDWDADGAINQNDSTPGAPGGGGGGAAPGGSGGEGCGATGLEALLLGGLLWPARRIRASAARRGTRGARGVGRPRGRSRR